MGIFFFFFLINSSLSPLSSHTSETLSPVYLRLSLFTLILFLSHPQSTLPTSSHCRAANLAWSRLAWSYRSRLELSCLELLSLSLNACGNVCNSGWLILVVVGWLILVGGDGFITMVGFGSGFVTVVGCGGGGYELGGSGSELLKWIFYFVFLYIYIVDFLMLF